MGLTRYQVPAWQGQAGLVHGFLGRGGGRSVPPYAGLNLSFRVGDDPSAVRENVSRVKTFLGLHGRCIVTMNQRHGDRIIDVNQPTMDAGEGDAMVTLAPELFLGVLTADCAPILFWSASHGQRVAAVVHAGWRGTLAGLAAKMVAHLDTRYGVRGASLQCAVGPTIDACCYEVGEEVVSQLTQQWGTNATRSVRRSEGRFHLNLRRLNAALVADAGVPEPQISFVGPCTACARHEFFSYRRETQSGLPARTGRQMSLIGWSPGNAASAPGGVP